MNVLSKGSKVGRFVIEEVIGKGGMSVVYRAHHQNTLKVCALKVLSHQLDEDQQRRWLQEAQIENLLGKSPHLVQIFDADIDPTLKQAFLAMELLDGTSMEKAPPDSQEIALGYLEQIATLLAQAHRRKVVHRDLKPHNLFLAQLPDGTTQLKVLDFGAARVLGDNTQHTATSIGTLFYAAPEQSHTVRDVAESSGLPVSKDITPAVDVWAFGLLAYEWLTGYPPGQIWGGKSPEAQIITKKIPVPSEAAGALKERLPPGFDAWFARCVHIDARKRYQDILEAFNDLKRLTNATPSPPAAVPAKPETRLKIETMKGPGRQPIAVAEEPTVPQVPPVPQARALETSMDSLQTFQPSAVTERKARSNLPERKWMLLAGGGVALMLTLGVGVLSFSGKKENRGTGDGAPPPRPSASASASTVELQKEQEEERKKKEERERRIGEMVKIPSGVLLRGAEGKREDEKPASEIPIPEFWMDRTEVTVAAWKLCVAEQGCTEKQGVKNKDFSEQESRTWSRFCTRSLPAHEDHPINCVDAEQAEAFCKWANKRLPTEEEWEYAARAVRTTAQAAGRMFSWGNQEPEGKLLNACDESCVQEMKKAGIPDFDTPMFSGSDGYATTAPVGKFPANAFGLHDMAGNVSEWTSSWYTPIYGASEDKKLRVSRGSNWESTDKENTRVTRRFKDPPDTRDVILGFRCARSKLTIRRGARGADPHPLAPLSPGRAEGEERSGSSRSTLRTGLSAMVEAGENPLERVGSTSDR